MRSKQRMARRRMHGLEVGTWACILGCALAVSTACGIDDLLIGAPCSDDGDCPNLECVRTASEVEANEPGRCNSNSNCDPGLQRGCEVDSSGSCRSGLSPSTGPDDRTYCCEGTNPTVISIADDQTAICFDCPTCSLMEPCLAGEDRCEVEGSAPCGCRVPEDELLDEPCSSDGDCGSLVCVRTLEQMEEPEEPAVPDRALEDGQCRPSDDPTCAPGQSGCLLPAGASCGANLRVVGVDTLEYCCPVAPTSFFPLVYSVSDDQSQAACTICGRCTDDAGNEVNQCTAVSDPECTNFEGLCGCPLPPTEE